MRNGTVHCLFMPEFGTNRHTVILWTPPILPAQYATLEVFRHTHSAGRVGLPSGKVSMDGTMTLGHP